MPDGRRPKKKKQQMKQQHKNTPKTSQNTTLGRSCGERTHWRVRTGLSLSLSLSPALCGGSTRAFRAILYHREENLNWNGKLSYFELQVQSLRGFPSCELFWTWA